MAERFSWLYWLTNLAWEGTGDFRIGRRSISADDLVLFAKKETLGRLVVTERKCEMEINIVKFKVMKISKGPDPLHTFVKGLYIPLILYWPCDITFHI